jgi:hypothetical protein
MGANRSRKKRIEYDGIVRAYVSAAREVGFVKPLEEWTQEEVRAMRRIVALLLYESDRLEEAKR